METLVQTLDDENFHNFLAFIFVSLWLHYPEIDPKSP